MNPAFWLIVALLLIAIWFASAWAFRAFGKFLHRIWRRTVTVITEPDENNTNDNYTEE